jgi:phasin family protein
MKPSKTPEDLAKLQQESIAAAIRFAQLTVEASQKLLGVQLDAARHAVEAGSRNVQALAQVKTPEEAMALRATLAGQAVEQALDYSESVYSVAAELQDQFGRLVEQRMDAQAADIQIAMEQMLAAAPPGAEAATAAVRSAIAVGQAAFDGMSRTTRQLSEMARTGVKAASDATADAVKDSGRRKR